MKKSLLSLVVAGLFAMSVTSAFATEKVTPSTTNNYDQRNYSTTNQGGNASQGQLQGQQQGQGQSQSATGGSATIQKGAVQNTNTNTANGGAGGAGGSATIQKGAVQNTVDTDISIKNSVNSESTSSVKNSGNSESTSKANANNNGNINAGEGGIGSGSNNTEINVAASKTYRPPVSSAIAPTIFPTAPCMGSSSVGATGTLFSISGGTTWTSEECMILETARSFDQAGYTADGLSVRCQGKWAKTAPSCKALAEAGKPAKAAEMAVPAKAVMAKPAVAETNVVKPTKAVAQVTVADPVTNAIVYSPNGYYSTVTNPLGQ